MPTDKRTHEFFEVEKEKGFRAFLTTAHASSTRADYARVWNKIWPVFLATTRGDNV